MSPALRRDRGGAARYTIRMIVWLVFAVMTGAVAFAILWPLARPAAAIPADAGDLDFYNAQLADIAREEARGTLASDAATAARAEAARRLLRASARDTVEPLHGECSLRRRRAASAFILSMIPLVSLGLYGALGSPELPGEPLVARLSNDPAKMGPFEAAARIEAHLAGAPDDGKGWDLIAPLYLKLGRADDAVRAYRHAIRLLGETPERLSDSAEAQVIAAGGVVSAEARKDAQGALKLEPANGKASLLVALAEEQDGNLNAARATYRGMIDRSATAPWVPMVRARLQALDLASTQK